MQLVKNIIPFLEKKKIIKIINCLTWPSESSFLQTGKPEYHFFYGENLLVFLNFINIAAHYTHDYKLTSAMSPP